MPTLRLSFDRSCLVTTKVEITFGKDVPSLEAFLSLLRYIYCGHVRMPPEDSLYIFSAPNFFGFSNSRLHSYCKASLEKDVCVDNVLTMLEAANAINMEVMKKHCLEMIATNFSSYRATGVLP